MAPSPHPPDRHHQTRRHPVTTTTADETEPDAAATPTDRAAELEADLEAASTASAEARADARRRLRAAVEAIEELRRVQTRYRRAEAEAEALEDAADVEVDVPEIDRFELGPTARRDPLHDAVEAVKEALMGENTAERRARGGRIALRKVRKARRSGDPDAARRAVHQLRDRLDRGAQAWLTDDVARDAWIAPAEDRERELRERAAADRALRWCASAWRGRVPGDPREAFPPELAEIVEEFVDTGALQSRNGPWSVPRSWYPAAAEPPPGALRGDRDLEAEIEAAVADLDDAALDRAHPDVASSSYAGPTTPEHSGRSRPATT